MRRKWVSRTLDSFKAHKAWQGDGKREDRESHIGRTGEQDVLY